MAKQERRIFDKDVQVWVHHYENLRNMAHWHFENELVVCQEGAAEIWTESSTLCTRATALFSAGNVSTIFAARLTAASQSHNLAIYFTRPVI